MKISRGTYHWVIAAFISFSICSLSIELSDLKPKLLQHINRIQIYLDGNCGWAI